MKGSVNGTEIVNSIYVLFGILNQPVITRLAQFRGQCTLLVIKNQRCFGDGFQCFGSSFNMNSAKESKKRRSVTISGFQYSIPDEIQTFLEEEFKSILDNRLHANNPRLSQLIKSDVGVQLQLFYVFFDVFICQ
ncbi:hypothetical protein HanIR_Chr05g0243451 [Helianthus annuus]|nr:hypothetical protein HanIR_Chr05g0243451 [Helianthus annuus]